MLDSFGEINFIVYWGCLFSNSKHLLTLFSWLEMTGKEIAYEGNIYAKIV